MPVAAIWWSWGGGIARDSSRRKLTVGCAASILLKHSRRGAMSRLLMETIVVAESPESVAVGSVPRGRHDRKVVEVQGPIHTRRAIAEDGFHEALYTLLAYEV